MSAANKKSRFGKGFLIIAIGIALIVSYFLFFNNKKEDLIPTDSGIVVEPQFKKEGTLSFLNPEGDTIKTIDIEIADNWEDRAQGLMYRSSMSYAQGMLFTFEEEEEQSFWMKNTKISLDIIYIDQEKKIVSIYKHTRPYSTSSLPSFKPAMYVVETLAGFTDKFGVKEGDIITFYQEEAPA